MSSIYPPTDRPTLVLERHQEVPHELEWVADAPLVAFDAFSVDHRIFGWVRLSADRLTDLLNAHAELALVNVQVEGLVDRRTDWTDHVVVRRDELIAVRAGGPSGDPARRRPARLYPIAVESGPFRILGYLHAEPGVAPLVEIRRRPPMIPLSSGWLDYRADGGSEPRWVGTILFNRYLARTIEVAREEDLFSEP